MTDERDRMGPISGGGDLLDLVRAAEEAAKVGTRSGPPSARGFAVADDGPVSGEGPIGDADADANEQDGRISGEVVDVGDDAIDAPPSIEPIPVAGLSPERSLARSPSDVPRVEPRPVRAVAHVDGSTGARLPPLLGILVVLALAILSLALLTRR